MKPTTRIWFGVGGAVSIGLLWWLLTSGLRIIDPFLLPGPITVLDTAIRLSQRGGTINPEIGGYGGINLLGHVLVSTMRVLLGFSISMGIAIPTALLIVTSRRAEQIVNPLIHLFRPIPPIAWVPLAVLWLGTTSEAITFIIVIGTVWPMILSAAAGFRRVPPVLIRAANSLGTNGVQANVLVMIPAAMPYLFTAARLTFGIAWWTIIPAELAAGKSGLGYLIIAAQENFDMPAVLTGMMAIGTVGLLLDGLLTALQQWRLFRIAE